MLLPLDKFLDRKPEIDTTPLSNITESIPSNVSQKTPTIIRNEDLRSRGGR